MEHNNNLNKTGKQITNVVIEKSDSIVAISGLFANIGVFGITLRKMNQAPYAYTSSSATTTTQVTSTHVAKDSNDYLGTGIYVGLIIFALFIAYGLWKFRAWGWLITVLFSVICILLVVPDILNYHAALVSMILLSYITQPTVREKYMK